MRSSYVLWLLTAVTLLAMYTTTITTTQAAHVREASRSSSYTNDPRPDAVNEETSDILGTGGAYEFRLPQPQINKQQEQQNLQKQHQTQQQHLNQHKTKRPNSTITYVTTTKMSDSKGSASSAVDSTVGASSQTTTKSSYQHPTSSTTTTSGSKIANGIAITTPTTASTQQFNNLEASYQSNNPSISANDEAVAGKDGDSSKKIIGSTSAITVVLNGNEPEFTDALGHKLPKPQAPLQVASPIDLLNPDRYEFYTFDENGDLVRRLMTVEEIQSIVANGDGENSSIVQYVPIDEREEPEKNVQDIVDSVQNVLNKEVESNKNISKDALSNLDTPDVTSSWSMILPAIFGESGSGTNLFPQQKPQQIVMTPDSELLETSTDPAAAVMTSTTTAAVQASKRPKPSKRKPTQKRKPTTAAPTTTSTAMTPQVVQEELGPHESVYTGIQEYQNVAANMQHFDGFSQLQMQPIYHKLPEQTAAETTTRRVFVNNQEVIESEGSTRPTTTSVGASDKVELNESYGKRPTVVGYNKRPLPPHRHKTPNGGEGVSTHTTKKPQATHNKQKIKKKPTAASVSTTTTTTTPEPVTVPTTTTTTTTSTTTPVPTTTTSTTTTSTTTTTPAPTTTTSTTTPEPTTTSTTTTTTTTPEPSTSTSTTTELAPVEPIISTTTSRPSATTPKKKKKKPTRQPGQQSTGKPHPVGEKRKPGTSKPTNGKPHPTSVAPTYTVHKQQHGGEGNKHHAANADSPTSLPPAVAEPTVDKHSSSVTHKPNRTRPRPHKKTTTTTTTTTTTPEPPTSSTTTTPAPTITTTSENTLIVEHFPGYHPVHVKVSGASKRPGVSHYPVPDYKPSDHKVQQQQEEAVVPEDFAQLKRKPLPSLSQIQQLKPAGKPTTSEEDHQTLSSFDQIIESLKEELTAEMGAEDMKESSASEKRPVSVKPLEIGMTKESTKVETSAGVEIASLATTDSKEKIGDYSTSSTQEAESLAETPGAQQQYITTMRAPTLVATSEEVTKKTTSKPTSEVLTKEESSDSSSVSEYSTEEYIATFDREKENDKTDEDSSHTVKFEPLYADVQEPIVSEIATTVSNVDETTIFEELNNKESSESEESSTEYLKPALSQNSPVTQKVEALVAEDNPSTTEPQPQFADLIPHLNMGVIQPTDQINMSDFQTQAATVASALVDGSNSYEHLGANDTRSELDSLMSDVIQQMTAGHEPDAYRIEAVAEEDGNRLTNFAQLNTSFLLNPTGQTKEQNESSEKIAVQTGSVTSETNLAKESSEESSETPSSKEEESSVDSATQVLTYASKGDENVSIQNVSTENYSVEKPDKEHKAELSEEISESSETEHKIELTDKEKYEVQQSIATETDNFEKLNEGGKENPEGQLQSSQKYDLETTTTEDLMDYESTTMKQELEEKYEEKYTESLNNEKAQIKVENISAQPLAEAGATTVAEESSREEISTEEGGESKTDEAKSTEEIITKIEKVNDAEVAKINEEINNREEEATEEEDYATTTKEFIAQTENILKDDTTKTAIIEYSELPEEQSTITRKEEEEEKEEQDILQLQGTENIAHKPQESLDGKEEEQNKLQLQATKTQEKVGELINETQVGQTKIESNKPAELPNEVTPEKTDETKVSSDQETTQIGNDDDVGKKGNEEKDNDVKDAINSDESNEETTSEKKVEEKDIDNEKVKKKATHEEEKDKKETDKTETHKKNAAEKEAIKQETSEQISVTEELKYTTEEESTEKENSSLTPALDASTVVERTEESITVEDLTESLENTTEKEITETTAEDDSMTNANNLQPQYTHPPTTEKQELKADDEYNSESNEPERTTILPDEKVTVEDTKESSESETATDVTGIHISHELNSTESDEEVYIKLGETTTRATGKLDKEEASSIDMTEKVDIEAKATETPQTIHANVSESLIQSAHKSDDTLVVHETQIQLTEVAAAEPAKKVVATEVETEPQKSHTSVTMDETASKPGIAKPVQEFVLQHQRPHQTTPQLSSEYRPDPQNPTDAGDLTAYIVPKFPTSPVLAALATSTSSSKTTAPIATSTTTTSTTTTTTTTPRKPTQPSTSTPTKRIHTLKPVSYYNKQSGIYAHNAPKPVDPTKIIPYSANTVQQRPMLRPAQFNNLVATSTQATRPPVKMEPSPTNSKGLEASVAHLDEDLQSFVRLCNELAFSYWKSITSEKISSARSLIVSPFALTSMLSMVFLGARGSTSGEMNEVLKLDDMVTFNPHLVFKNITDSVELASDSDIATAAFVREIFSDRANGKILQFFKEKTQQFYAGHVEEVNFNVVNDVIRRRTNLLVKRHTMGKVLEYLRTNSLWVNGPLATISANLFQTDCRRASTHLTDGEMFFQVHPSVRQRRLIPIPAVLYRSGFTAGYEPNLDATIVAFGSIQDTVSTIYVMPGHQSTLSPAESLERLERELVEQAFSSKHAWSNILTSLMDRPGMEVQLPRFSHRSFVNASLGLQKMGLKGLFKSDFADLRGLTGSSNRDIYLSDVIQINTFSTCGEEKIADHHHVEMYPAPPLRKRNKDLGADGVGDGDEDGSYDSSEAVIDFGSLVHDSVLGRGFYDDLLDPKYLELPLSLRPRQARVPDNPRLRFDKPFLYFVRHNPTGIVLFMGRFNPRLLP